MLKFETVMGSSDKSSKKILPELLLFLIDRIVSYKLYGISDISKNSEFLPQSLELRLDKNKIQAGNRGPTRIQRCVED